MRVLGAAVNSDYDLAAGGVIHNAVIDATNPRLVQFDIAVGDGVNNLAGAGGDFTLLLTVDGNTFDGSVITKTVDAAITRIRFQSGMVLVPSNATVAITLTSPDAADTVVDVTVQAYDTAPLQPSTAARTLAVEAGGGLPDLTTVLSGQPAQKYNGLRGPGVYLDTTSGTSGTVLGTNGTVHTPCLTLADAITLCGPTNVGAKRIYLKGSSTLVLTGQTLDGYEIVGLNGADSNTVNLGTAASPSALTNVDIFGCTVYGTHNPSDRLTLTRCELTDAPTAEVTTLHVFAMKCLVVGDIVVDTSEDNVFLNCSDGVLGGGDVVFTASGAAGTILIQDWTGGLVLQDLSANHKVRLSGSGNVTFESGSHPNADIKLYGNWGETDNTAGMTNITREASFNRSLLSTITTLLTTLPTDLLDFPDGVETGVTLRQYLQRSGAAVCGIFSGAASGLETAVGMDGVTPRVRYTTDEAGNRIAVEYDPV